MRVLEKLNPKLDRICTSMVEISKETPLKKTYLRYGSSNVDLNWHLLYQSWEKLRKDRTLDLMVFIYQQMKVQRIEDTSLWLPWYRGFLSMFEELLQNLDCNLPYWDTLPKLHLPDTFEELNRYLQKISHSYNFPVDSLSFLMLHCFLDREWLRWSETHKINEELLSVQLPLITKPLNSRVYVRDVVNPSKYETHTSMGYSYI